MLQITNLTPASFIEGAEPVEIQRPRKRQRKVLSCDSCHKQKVKCDRQQPCSRCIAGNRREQCCYTGRDSSPAEGTHDVPTQQSSPATSDATLPSKAVNPPITTVWRKGRARFSGLTHWAQLAVKMEEAAPFIRGDSRELESLINRMKTLKGLYPAKRLRSFPFGDSINTGLPSLPRLSFLPPRYLVEQLVDNYLHTFERSYPLLDSAGFKRELSSFWNQPDAIEDGWLALLYMVLALSCYASPSIWFLEVPGGYLGLAKRCIDGAEAAFLMRGMFMTKPDLTSLRVLCLLSIGKLLDIITLDDSDGSWVFMGFVMRVGMSMCLHIGPASFPTMPAKEAVARRRIWNTLMLLDSTTALDSGMPLLLRPEDYDSTAFLRSNCRLSEEIPADRLVDENYQNLLADAAPIVAFIINKANSTSPRFGRNQILEYDDKIRHLLRKVEGCITSQRTVLEVLLHRCILAIHQSCSLNPGVGHCDEVDHCRRILHDSALGLLQLQSSLHDDPSHHWLSGLFVRDFGVAGLYVCDGLRNNTFLDTLKGQHSKYSAFSALKRLQTILKANLHHSRHYYKMYKAYAALISGLEALAAGSSIRDALYKAGLDIIAAVEECMGPRAEDDSSNLATLVDPLLQLDPIVNANFDFDGIDFPLDEFLSDFFWTN